MCVTKDNGRDKTWHDVARALRCDRLHVAKKDEVPVAADLSSAAPRARASLLQRRIETNGTAPLALSEQIPALRRPSLQPIALAQSNHSSNEGASPSARRSMSGGQNAARRAHSATQRRGLLGLPEAPASPPAQPGWGTFSFPAPPAQAVLSPAPSATASAIAAQPPSPRSMAANAHPAQPLPPAVDEADPPSPIVYPPRPRASVTDSSIGGAPLPWPGRKYGEHIYRHIPAAWFLLNCAGAYLYLLGGIAIERGVFATQPVVPPPPGPMPMGPSGFIPDGPRPDLLAPFSTPQMAIGVGAGGVALGASMSLFAFQRYWADGVAATRHAPIAMHLKVRPYGFFAAQAVCLALAVYFRGFTLEALRDHGQKVGVWSPIIAGSVASGVFSAVQAQAFSSAEVLRGPVVARHRNAAARGARTFYGIGLRLLSYLVVTSQSGPARQAMRTATFASLSVACAMPLTMVRHVVSITTAQHGAFADPLHARRKKLWGRLPNYVAPPLLMMAYMIGQFLGGVFAVPVSRLAIDDINGPGSGTFNPSRGPIPPPRQPNAEFYAAIVGVAVGYVVEVLATYAFWRDARRYAFFVEDKARRLPEAKTMHTHRIVNLFFAGAILSSTCLLAGRVATETAKPPLPAALEGVAVTLGVAVGSLQQLCLPELYAYSQVIRGRPPLPYLQEALIAARFCGGMLADLWAIVSGLPKFNSFGRDALLVASNFSMLIGIGVPTGVAYHDDAKSFGEAVDAYIAGQQQDPTGTDRQRRNALTWVPNDLT